MLFVECPHCHCMVFIEQINCQIFRHAVYKSTDQPIPPHSSKETCDLLVETDKVYGCAKPFKLESKPDGTWKAIICDYI